MPQPLLISASLSRRFWIECALVTLLAAVPRFLWLDHMEFKRDEAVLHARAIQIQPGSFPLHGIDSSLGVPNPPIALYLFAVPTLFSDSPLAMAGFSALLGTLTVAGVYAFGELLITRYVGLTAALLMIPAPWAVLLSRKIWAQDLLPFFSITLLAAFVAFWQRPRPCLAVAIPLLVAIALQIHFSMVLVMPLAIVALGRALHARLFISAALGIALAVAVCAPFLLFLRDYGLQRYVSQVRAVGHQLPIGENFLRANRNLADLSDSGSLQYMTTTSARDFLVRPDPPPVTRWLQAPLLLLGLVIAAMGWAGSAGRWLAAWCLLAIAAFTWGARQPHPHYLAACIPPLFLLMAVVPWCLPAIGTASRQRFWTAGALGVLALLAVVNVVSLSQFFRSLGRETWPGDYGPPYVERQQAVAFLADWQTQHPDTPWALWLGPDDSSPLAGDAFLLAHLARLQGLPFSVTHELAGTQATSDPATLAVCLSGPQPDLPPLSTLWQSPSGLLHVAILPATELRQLLSPNASTP
jgi:hypothetical protein